MSTPAPKTDAERFFQDVSVDSIHDVPWLVQQRFRLERAARKNSGDVMARLALAQVWAFLGQRDKALAEAEAVYNRRQWIETGHLANLAGQFADLGDIARAHTTAADIVVRPDYNTVSIAKRIISATYLRTGDVELSRQTINSLPKNKIGSISHQIEILDSKSAVNAYANHQHIVIDIIGSKLCLIDIDYIEDDSGPFIGQGYYVSATPAEVSILEQQLFEALDRNFMCDGRPCNPLASILSMNIFQVPALEHEAAA